MFVCVVGAEDVFLSQLGGGKPMSVNTSHGPLTIQVSKYDVYIAGYYWSDGEKQKVAPFYAGKKGACPHIFAVLRLFSRHLVAHLSTCPSWRFVCTQAYTPPRAVKRATGTGASASRITARPTAGGTRSRPS
jgi:hypothetical protein